MRIPGRCKTSAPRTGPAQPSVGDLAAAAAIIDTYHSMRTDGDPPTVRKPLARAELSFALRPPVPEVADHLFETFPGEPRRIETVGGAAQLLAFDHGPFWTVCTLGVSRFPVTAGVPTELYAEALPEHVDAVGLVMRTAVEVIAENRRVWDLGHVWINERPLLRRTLIQALQVVAGPATATVRAPDGAPVAHLRPLRLLTNAEARSYVLDGPEQLEQALRERPGALRDIDRSADLATTSTVPDVGCFVTKMLREAPVGWVEVEQDGQFWAFSRTESQAYLDDANNFELWSLHTVVERNPGLRQFAALAGAGDFADWQDGAWVTGRLEDIDDG